MGLIIGWGGEGRHGRLHKPSTSVKFWPKSFHKSSVIFDIFHKTKSCLILTFLVQQTGWFTNMFFEIHHFLRYVISLLTLSWGSMGRGKQLGIIFHSMSVSRLTKISLPSSLHTMALRPLLFLIVLNLKNISVCPTTVKPL